MRGAAMGEMDGRVAVVTAGARGIGGATVRALALMGARVVLNDLDARAAEETARALRDEGLEVRVLAGDAGGAEGAEALIGGTVGELGRIDALVNCVGGGGPRDRPAPRSFYDTTWELMQDVYALNLAATFFCTRAARPHMRSRGYGRIVNVASLAGRSRSVTGGPAYAAAKAAVIGLTRHLSGELGTDGITINAVAPGVVFSERIREKFQGMPAEEQQQVLAGIPLGRAAEPNEPAAAIAFLCTPASSYMTGAVLDVNGGLWVG